MVSSCVHRGGIHVFSDGIIAAQVEMIRALQEENARSKSFLKDYKSCVVCLSDRFQTGEEVEEAMGILYQKYLNTFTTQCLSPARAIRAKSNAMKPK